MSSCAIDAFASGPASCAFSAGDNRRNKNPAKDKSEARVRLPVNVDFIALPLKEPEVSTWLRKPVYIMDLPGLHREEP